MAYGDSQSLVLYRGASSSTSLAASTTSTSLLPSRLFNAQTGTAIATELLYRLLIDIINRILQTVHKFASSKLDDLSDYIEKRSIERRERWAAEKDRKDTESSRILDEVRRVRQDDGSAFICPLTGDKPRGGPPRWVKGVLTGVRDGRMQSRDFYTWD